MDLSKKRIVLLQIILLASSHSAAVSAQGFFDNLTKDIGSVVGKITKSEEDKNLPRDVQDAQDKDRGTGALIGAGAGAVIGKMVGKDSKSTAIGAAIGTTVGAVVGEGMAQGRGKYAKKYYDVNTSIANTEKRVSELKRQEREIERSIRLRNAEIRELRQQVSKGKQVESIKRRFLEDLEVDVAKAESTRIQLRKDVKLVENELADIEVAMNSSSNIDELKRAKVELAAQRNDMLTTLTKLNGMRNELKTQRQAIGNA